ncbi:MAG: aldose 1-epimerase [Bryobacteraceae bacterium]
MSIVTIGRAVPLALAFSLGLSARNYRAEQTVDRGVPVVRLTDRAHGVEVSIAPGIGNRAYEMKVHGKNILHFPFADVGEHQKRPDLCGIPFLAPWADLLSEQAFWANGKKYQFNMGLGNVRGKMPSHGLLTASPLWRVVEVKADGRSARVTSRLEFWKYPDLMAQWPFAHEYEMTYSLAGGVLEVKTTITNLSTEAMPVAIAYHPYFTIPDVPRDEWTARYPAKIHVIPGEHNIPTGELRPLDVPNPLPLRGHTLDDGFTEFERDAQGRAHFSIESGGKKVETLFGPKYPVVTIWLPNDRSGKPREFICFEPSTAIINGINLAHDGKWQGLQTLAAREKWTESFWVRAEGL